MTQRTEEKLEIARKQFEKSNGCSDRIIANDVKEETAYPMAADIIILASKDYKNCSQDMNENMRVEWQQKQL